MSEITELERIERAKQSWNEQKKQGRSIKKFNAMNKRFSTNYKNKRTKFKKQERKPLEILKCTCGNPIRMFNKQDKIKCFRCNGEWNRVDEKWAKVPRKPLEVIECDCGNKIKLFNKHEGVKCFKCNGFHDKINDVWVKDTKFETQRDGMTLGDILVKIKKRKN